MNEGRRRLRRSQAQEKRVARATGSMQHSGSGNGDFRKNDMAQIEGLPHERMHIECKRTDGKRQITIKATDLTDLLLNATRAGGKVPALYFELDGEDWLVMQPGDVVDRV